MKRFFNWIRKKTTQESNSPESMTSLLNMLAMTEAHEIDCDDVFKALAEFAEMNQRGKDVAEMMPLVKKHLELCPDCREEYEILMDILKVEQQISA